MFQFAIMYSDFKQVNQSDIKGEQSNLQLAQNLAINKKSTIVVQSLWNLVKIFISRVLYVAGISAWLD